MLKISNTFRRITRRTAVACFVAAGLLLSQCNPDDTAPPAPPATGSSSDNEYIAENGPKLSTTITGTVIDEAARPVAGALVEAYGETATTDANGGFTLSSISVPARRCYLKCSKDGYFTASTAYIPAAGNHGVVRLVLMSDAPTHQVDAAAGGTATLPDGSSVQLPAGGVVDADGAPYTGEVNVTVHHLNPADANFRAVIPGGDLAARRTDNSGAILYSYGMLRVLLRDADGNDLQLAKGKESTLTMRLPESQLADAPATIPLWYFDEKTGLWLEEGEATRQGNKYVGKVKHFTDWNCDLPGQGVEVELQFVSEGGGPGKVEEMPVDPENPGEPIVTGGIPCTGYPTRNVLVSVGQMIARTDENGFVRMRVPDGRAYPVLLYNGPGHVQKIADVGPFSRGEPPVKRKVTAPCPVFVVGRTVCNGTPFQADFILNTNEILSYGKRPTDEKGVFRVTVAPGYESTITVTDPSTGKKRNITFTAPKEDGVTVTLGNIELCATPQAQVNDNVITLNGDGYTNETMDLKKIISPDGNPLYGYCQEDGQATKAVVGNSMVDKVSLSLSWPGCGKPGIFKGICPAGQPCSPNMAVTIVKDGKRYNYYTWYGPDNSEKGKNNQITITRSDDKLIEGTFSGIVTRYDSKANTWHDLEIKDAKFSVRTVKQ